MRNWSICKIDISCVQIDRISRGSEKVGSIWYITGTKLISCIQKLFTSIGFKSKSLSTRLCENNSDCIQGSSCTGNECHYDNCVSFSLSQIDISSSFLRWIHVVFFSKELRSKCIFYRWQIVGLRVEDMARSCGFPHYLSHFSSFGPPPPPYI